MPRPGAADPAEAEQPQVVVVARARQPQEGGVGPGLAGDDLHPEGPGPEAQRALEIGDEQDGVVEPDGRDGRGSPSTGSGGRADELEGALPGPAVGGVSEMLRKAISSRLRAYRRLPASTGEKPRDPASSATRPSRPRRRRRGGPAGRALLGRSGVAAGEDGVEGLDDGGAGGVACTASAPEMPSMARPLKVALRGLVASTTTAAGSAGAISATMRGPRSRERPGRRLGACTAAVLDSAAVAPISAATACAFSGRAAVRTTSCPACTAARPGRAHVPCPDDGDAHVELLDDYCSDVEHRESCAR